MSNKIYIETQDLNRALKDIHKYSENVQTMIKTEIKDTVEKIALDAKRLVPFGRQTMLSPTKKNPKNRVATGGGLRASIKGITYPNKFAGKVGTNLHYAPYVEFGTGTKVKVPKGLEDYAMQFKGKGVREVNLPARPYLFPSVESESPKYIKRIEKILGTVK